MAADEEIDGLYALPLGDFVRERDALARRLKDAGENARAAEVKSLTKPTVAAWAVNQLARRDTSKVNALLKAGERLRREQASVLRGGSPERLRAATDEVRMEAEALVDAARALLSEGHKGASEATLARIHSTLEAGAVDEVGRELVARGRVTRELEPAGFELLASLDPGAAPPRPAVAATRPTADARRLAKAEATAAELRSTVRQLKQNVASAERAALASQRAAEKAARHLRGEQERLEQAKSKLERAEDKLASLGEDA